VVFFSSKSLQRKSATEEESKTEEKGQLSSDLKFDNIIHRKNLSDKDINLSIPVGCISRLTRQDEAEFLKGRAGSLLVFCRCSNSSDILTELFIDCSNFLKAAFVISKPDKTKAKNISRL
jgi:hypothetical protein